jgi:hypothetical protein
MFEVPSDNILFIPTNRPVHVHTNGHAGPLYVYHTGEMWLSTYGEGVWGTTDPVTFKPSLIGGGVTFMLWLLYFRDQLGGWSGHGVANIAAPVDSGASIVLELLL